jgi:hypothetical protein
MEKRILDYEYVNDSTGVATNVSLRDRRIRWARIVEDYTKKSLTKPFDKLPAVSGLAKKLFQIYDGEYRAGIWTDDLMFDLLWCSQTKDDSPTTSRPEEVRSPSWSWASVEGPIEFSQDANVNYYGHFIIEPRSKILAVEVIPVLGADDFGAVTYGSIQFRGRVKLARVGPQLGEHPRYRELRNVIQRAEAQLYSSTSYATSAYSWHEQSLPPRVIGTIQFDVDSEIEDHPTVYCLPICGIKDPGNHSPVQVPVPSKREFALALVKTEIPNEYKRVGYVIFSAERFEFMKHWFNTPGCKDELINLI